MAPAKDHDSCCDNAEAIRRVEDRMRDDHHSLTLGQSDAKSILKAILACLKNLAPKLDKLQSDVSALKSGNTNSKFDFYLRVVTILAVGIAAIYAKGGF